MALHMEKLNRLQPAFKKKAIAVIQDMEKSGWHIQVVFGFRTKAQNNALGRNASRSSKHLLGLAVDIIDTKVQWHIQRGNFGHPFCKDMDRICKKHNVYWGGNFIRTNSNNRWDPCHFQATR